MATPPALVPISGLPTAAALTGAELVAVVQGGVTSQTTVSDLSSQLDILAVATYAALTALTAPARVNGNVYSTSARATANDGGFGFWTYDSASVATANGGTVLAPNDNVGRYLRIYDDAILPRWFGAKGDGTTADDTAMWAAADVAKTLGIWLDGEGLTYALATPKAYTGAATYRWRYITFKKPAKTSVDYEWTVQITGEEFGTAILAAANIALGSPAVTLASASGVAAGQKYLLISDTQYNPSAGSYSNSVSSKSEWVRVGPGYVSGVCIPLSATTQSSYTTAAAARIYRFYETCTIEWLDVAFIGGGAGNAQGGARFNRCTILDLVASSTNNEYEAFAYNLCGFRSPATITAAGSNLAGYGYGMEIVGCDTPLASVYAEDCRHAVTMGASYQTTLPGGGGNHYILGRGGNLPVISGPNSRGSVFDTHVGHIRCSIGSVTGSLAGGAFQTYTAANSGGALQLTYATDMPQGAPIKLYTTGTTPTNTTADTTYYLIRTSATTGKLALTAAAAAAGTAIAYGGAGTGTQTVTSSTFQEALTIESFGFDIRSIQVTGADLGIAVLNYGRPTDEPSPTVTLGSIDLGRGGVDANAILTVANRDAIDHDAFFINVNNMQGDFPAIASVTATDGSAYVHFDSLVGQSRAYHGIHAVSTAYGQAVVTIDEGTLADNANSASYYLLYAEGTLYERANPGVVGAKISVNSGSLSTLQTAMRADAGLITLGATVGVSAGTVSYTAGIGSINREVISALGSLTLPLSGRLSSATGLAVPLADQLAVTSLYVVPYLGDIMSVWDGVDFVPRRFAEATIPLVSNTAHAGYHQASKVFDVGAFVSAGALTFGTTPAWTSATARSAAVTTLRSIDVNNASIVMRHGATQTFTASDASGSLLLTVAAEVVQGQEITVSNSGGALPTGIAASTTYYAIWVSATTFKVATSAVNAANGTAIAYTNAGTGTQTMWRQTTVAANKVTMVGTFYTNALAQTEDSRANRLVWNFNNPVERPVRILEATDSWNYSTAAYQQVRASALNQITVVRGLDRDVMRLTALSQANSSTATIRPIRTGIGLDSTTANISEIVVGVGKVDTEARDCTASYVGFPGLGYHYLAWLERGAGSDTQTWYGDAGVPTYVQSGMNGTVYT